MPTKKVISIIGVMPDGVFPVKPVENGELDFVSLYYRTDGNLYLFDSSNGFEHNLFNMPIPSNSPSCIINPFG